MRGRFFLLLAMILAAMVAAGWLLAPRAGSLPQGAVSLPSGQVVTLLDVISNVPGSEGLATRFRFLAPQIAREGGAIDAETAGKDMDWLCQNYALVRLSDLGPQPSQVIISLMDMDVPFGESRPEATQFIVAYAVEDGTCQLDMF